MFINPYALWGPRTGPHNVGDLKF